MDTQVFRRLEEIAASVKAAGFDPYDQLVGYLRTGNDRYITRNGDARTHIKDIDRKDLKEYCFWLKEKK